MTAIAPSNAGTTGVPGLSPAQQQVWSGLMAAGEARPEFDPLLPARLVDTLEERLAPVAERLGVGEVVIAKNMLAQVHMCERMLLAERRDAFAWSARTAAGT